MHHYFGVDLGTTQCSVGYVVDSERTQRQSNVSPETVIMSQDSIRAEEPRRIPSLLALVDTEPAGNQTTQSIDFGWDVFQRLNTPGHGSIKLLRNEHNAFLSVKSDMGTNRIYPHSKIDGMNTPTAVTAELLRRLSQVAAEHDKAKDPRSGHCVITVPASFSALARRDTISAAIAAGFNRERIDLLDEPVAAMLDALNHQDASAFLTSEYQTVMVFDFGGGTCDLALMEARLAPAQPLGIQLKTIAISPYSRVGGDDIDRAVMDQVVWKQICSEKNRRSLSEQDRQAVTDTLLLPVARKLKEDMCRIVAAGIRKRSDGSWPPLDDVEKVVARMPGRISLGDLRLPAKNVTMTAVEFESVMEPFVAVPEDIDDPSDQPCSIIRPIFETLEKAGRQPGDLNRLLLNGGSCLNPFVKRMLLERLHTAGGFQKLSVSTVPSLTESVAKGAALMCYWRHARRVRLVAPIVAETFGIITQNGQAVELVPAGVPLPFPGQEALHSVEGRLMVPPDCGPEMLVPYFAGYSGPDRAPKRAGTITIPLSEAVQDGASVSVQLRVTEDKELQWWFSIGGDTEQPAVSIPDPWTRMVPSRYQRTLAKDRQQLRGMVDAKKPIPNERLVSQANLVRESGDTRAALLALEDLLESDSNNADILNFRALCYWDLKRWQDALASCEAAANANPSNAVYRGNVGAVQKALGRLQEARANIRLALSMDETLAYLYDHLSSIERQEGNEGAAIRELKRAEALYVATANATPTNPSAWEDVARMRSSMGDYEGAAEARVLAARAEEHATLGGSTTDVVMATAEVGEDGNE